MNDAGARQDGSIALDPENPWPGLDFFGEHAQDYFHGRDAEAEGLLRRVTDASLTVLFGKSGLGKTSLLKAGLFPRLRRQHFLPLYVRLAIRPDAPPLIDQVADVMRATFAEETVDAPSWPQDQMLWEFLHRRDVEFWDPQNFPLVPIIVLDQFEELFSVGQDVPAAVARFKIELADLAENRIPEVLAARMTADASLAEAIDVRAVPCKFIISLREDFLPDLEGWRRTIPSLGGTRLRLLPMRPEQAMAAVYDTAPHLMDQDIARRIVEFVAAAQTAQTGQDSQDAGLQSSARVEIEPALLSLFCRGLNERRKAARQARFDVALIDEAKQGIISDYYRSCVDALPPSVSRFIENELITEKGFRNSYSRDDAVPEHLSEEQLDHLIKRRLVRIEEQYGAERIELTHDLLTRAIMEHRTRRRHQDLERQRALEADLERQRLESESRRQRARFRVAAAIAAAGLLLAGLAGYQWFLASQARVRADEALRESQARDLATQSMLVGSTNPTRALELALSSIDRKQTPQSDVALRLAFSRARLRGVVSPPAGVQFIDGEVSPTGDRILVTRSDGAVEIRAIPSLELLHSLPDAGTLASTGSTPASSEVYLGSDPEDVIVVTHGDQISRLKARVNSRSTILPLRDPKGWSMRLAGMSDRLLVHDAGRTMVVNLSTGAVTDARLCEPEVAPRAAATVDGITLVALFQGERLCNGTSTKSLKVSGAPSSDGGRFSPDAKRFATSTVSDEVVRVWDVEGAKEIATIRGFTAAPSTVFFAGPQDIAVGVFDGVAELWHFPLEKEPAQRADQVAQLTGAAEPVSEIFAVNGGQSILTLHSGGPLRLWQGLSSVPESTVEFENAIEEPIVNSQGTLAAMDLAGRVGRATSGAATLLSPLASSSGPEAAPKVRSRSQDRTHMLAASADGLVRIWDLDNQKVAAEFTLNRPLATAVWSTPGCAMQKGNAQTVASQEAVTCAIATVDIDRVLRVHVLDGTNTAGPTWKLPDRVGLRGLLSPDWKHWIEPRESGLVVVDLEKTAIVARELENAKLAGRWPFVQLGKSIVVQRGYFDTFLQPLDGSRDVRLLKGHATAITSTVVSPDGSRVLTASDDWTARLWDASSGQLLSTLRGHVSGVTDAIFSRDGSLVATHGRDRSIRVWEPASGTSIFRFELGSNSFAHLSDFNGSSIVYYDSTRAWTIDCEPCRSLPELVKMSKGRLNVHVR